MNLDYSALQGQLVEWLCRRTPSAGIRRVAPLAAALASEQGRVREENQDRAVVVRGTDKQGQPYMVVAVADGIGGMIDGATCAALTIGSFIIALHQHVRRRDDSSENLLRKAAETANDVVFNGFQEKGGSTLSAVLIRGDSSAYWLNVGDSRIYYSVDNQLTQMSVDDTIAGQLGKNPEEAIAQSKLLQFIGMGGELEAHVAAFGTDKVGTAIVTTDGVHYLNSRSSWMSQLIHHSANAATCVKRLVEVANWCGGSDNATVVAVDLAEVQISTDRPHYSCLEVWDPFGELQIIALGSEAESAQRAEPTSKPPPIDSETSQSNRGSALKKGNSKRNASEKQRPRKQKGVEKRREHADKKSDAPQLYIDFPRE